MVRGALLFLICCALSAGAGGWARAADEAVLRVLVIENAPPMSYRDSGGQLTGFSVEVARAICDEMGVKCHFDPVTQHVLTELLSQGKADFAAAGLLDTPERRAKFLFARPYYRSMTLWLARAGVRPGQPGVKVAVVAGSAQDSYARKQGWVIHPVTTNGELGQPMMSGEAQAILAPMMSAINVQAGEEIRQLELVATVMPAPELTGDAAFGISPYRPDLQKKINQALDRIKRNGTYDRINSRFLPFRVS
ncbi:MAG: amino acid transporter substrate-binding protein, family [Proteobacteria bacterium]|nr:amino acid transporter substrate-binding protein, family [Pseudomonadota bacterium]